MKVVKILDTTLFRTCIIKKELVEAPDGTQLEMKSAYSLVDGSYIGNCDWAQFFEENGIMPQAIPGNKVASIGFCQKEQKWHSWSHRARCSFGIGSKVKKGDCAYKPIDPQDMLDDMIKFWVDGENENVTATKILHQELDAKDPYHDLAGLGALLETECMRKKDGKILGSKHWKPYPGQWGRGEWEAKTLDDAKQMAIDYARSVA